MALILKTLTSCLLIISLTFKLIHLEYFEFSLVETGISNWYYAAIIARIVIIVEFIIATSILFHSIKPKILSSLLLLLCIFYGFDLFLKPEDGMFSSYFLLSFYNKPIVISTLSLLLLSLYIHLKHTPPAGKRKRSVIINISLFLIISILTFSTNPIYIDDFQKNETSVEKSNLDWSTIYQNCEEKNIILTPETEVFFAFLSTSCYYCNSAAIRLGVSKRAKLNATQIVLVFPGNIKDTEYFIERNRCDFPYIRISKDEFRKLAGNEFPAFFKVKNKKETNYYTGRTLNLRELDNLFQLN